MSGTHNPIHPAAIDLPPTFAISIPLEQPAQLIGPQQVDADKERMATACVKHGPRGG